MIENPKEYWKARYGKDGPQAVGLSGATAETQSQIDKERQSWITSKIPLDLRTIDFGCGTGKMASYFPFYIGMDLSKEGLQEARKRNPGKTFLAPSPIAWDFDIFLTVTVLQHNTDEEVKRIFSLVEKPKGFWFALYEKAEGTLPHCLGRSGERYQELVEESGFKVFGQTTYIHTIHGEAHGLHLMEI